MATSPALENNQSLLKQCTACVERAWRDRVHLHIRRVELCVSDIVRTPVQLYVRRWLRGWHAWLKP